VTAFPAGSFGARVDDYWLGGKDNFEADRRAGEETIAAYPLTRLSARANRAFLARTVRYLAAVEGIRQYLDIGTGLPTANNTHEVVQSVAPESRIVYVDNGHCPRTLPANPVPPPGQPSGCCSPRAARSRYPGTAGCPPA
jgi:S-adenosyl methyltransferase